MKSFAITRASAHFDAKDFTHLMTDISKAIEKYKGKVGSIHFNFALALELDSAPSGRLYINDDFKPMLTGLVGLSMELKDGSIVDLPTED